MNNLSAAMLRPVMGAIGGDKLSILIYHRVLREPDPIFPEEIDAGRFDQQLMWLKAFFNVVPLAQAIEGLKTNTLPRLAACITFDDGYADNAEVALPILQKHEMSATFFISAGFLDGGRMWNDSVIEGVRNASGDVLDLTKLGLGTYSIATSDARRAAIDALIGQLKYLPPQLRSEKVAAIMDHIDVSLPNNLMMSSAQVCGIHRAGMEIGGHTMSHPILTRLSREMAKAEIDEGRRVLEDITGDKVRLFAYPNGKPGEDYAQEHVELVRELGFDAAVSTAWGVAGRRSDLFQLPRFTPWDRTQFRFGLRLTKNLTRVS